MIGFGEDNSEFGGVPPAFLSCEEVTDNEGFAENALRIKIVTNTGITLQISFPSYIMHLTRNESYTVWDYEEVRKGNYLVVFSKSKLIDFYDQVIAHTDDYSWPGRGTHYAVYGTDHLVDVIADAEPVITRV